MSSVLSFEVSSSGPIGAEQPDSSASGPDRHRAPHLNPRLDVQGLEAVDVLDPHRNEVFRVHQSANPTDDDVVVKLLKPEFEPILPRWHGGGSRKLIRAVRQSEGWVPVLRTGTAGGRDYIVQPYYRRGSLVDLLERGGHWRSSLSMVGNAAAVVGQLGARGLALGCLRPSYVLVDDDTVVVSVFGMSTRRFDDGSTQYLAPEQQGGSEPTPACDVYTLGLILAELLAGRQRGPDEPVRDLITTLPDSVPTLVIDLLDHAVTSRVTNRIANAALFDRAIIRLLAKLPGDTGDTTVGSATTANADRDPTMPENPVTATAGLDEAEDGRGWISPKVGPLDDLLEPRMARSATRHHRPTAGPRLVTELELEMMIEALRRLPMGADSDDENKQRDDPDSGRTFSDPDGGATE